MWSLENTPFIKWKSFLDFHINNEWNLFKKKSFGNLTETYLQKNVGISLKDVSSIDENKGFIEIDYYDEPLKFSFKPHIVKRKSDLITSTNYFVNQLPDAKKKLQGNFYRYIDDLLKQIIYLIDHPNNRYEFLKNYFKKLAKRVEALKEIEMPIESLLILGNKEEAIAKAKKLYGLLIKEPPFIDCHEKEFVAAFTKKKVKAGVRWLAKGSKNKNEISKVDIFYLLFELRVNEIIDPDYTNKMVKYVFRNPDGAHFTNVRSSRNSFNKWHENPNKTFTPNKYRIKDIISELK